MYVLCKLREKKNYDHVNTNDEKLVCAAETLAEEDEEFPSIESRTVSAELVRAFKSLNEAQRNAVKEMGFERVMDLEPTETPKKLGYWLVRQYDPLSQTLKIPNQKPIRITEDEVAYILGLPQGKVEMKKKNQKELGQLLVEWWGVVGKPNGHITAKQLCTAMLELKEGGVWFKRHFAILLVTTLIESTSFGYCNHQYIQHFGDVSKIKDLNWCGLLHRALTDSRLQCEPKHKTKFTGPILFLTVCLPHIHQRVVEKKKLNLIY